jgi:hypothetical protein
VKARGLLILVLPVFLASCAVIPNSGSIERGTPVGADPNNQVIRVIARPPQPGMSPQEVVQGFLDASASFEGDHAVARQYLTDAQSALWKPSESVTVYDGLFTIAAGSTTSLKVTSGLYAVISNDGSFRVATPPRSVGFDFRVERVGDEWRIADVPRGLLLSRADVDRSFRSFNLYFFNSNFDTLVPDPRMIPVQESGLATTLIRELVAGPSDWLAPAVRTAIPDGTTLAIDAVPIDAGTARVDLDQRVLLTNDETRRALSAQIVWTLRQVATVAAVDIRASGQSLPVSGVLNPQSSDAWMSYNPDAAPYPDTPFAVSGGRAINISDASVELVAGGAGIGDPPLSAIAVSAAGGQIAGVDAVGNLWRGAIAVGSPISQITDAPGRSFPQFDNAGNIWTLGTDGVLRVVSSLGVAAPVTLENFPAKASLLAMSLSPDDARMGLVLQRGPRRVLILARVVANGGAFTLAGPRRVETVLTDVLDIAWNSSESIAALALVGAGAPQVYEVDLAQGTAIGRGAPVGPRSIAAAPGVPILVGTDSSRIFSLVGDQWVAGAFGNNPTYAH